MTWVFGVVVIVLIIAAFKINRSSKNLGFPVTRKRREKPKKRSKTV
jgi:hypothetical protein